MEIEHIAMYVKDLERTREFFEKYFGAVSNKKYHNIKTVSYTHLTLPTTERV